MVSLKNKHTNKVSMLQDEEVKPVLIAEPDVIFHEVLEEVRNWEKKLNRKDAGIEEE